MPLELALCDDGDMDRAFAIISDGFGEEHPYFNYVFPKHNTVTGRKVGGERFRAMKQGDPTASYIKITDNTTGVIIAVTKWNIYDGKIPEEVTVEGDFWDSEIEKQLAQEMFSGYLLPRRQAIKAANGRIICLDMMAVDPKFQRKGAGRMLTRWGTEIADKMGVLAVVEATRQGRGLYASEGFQVQNDKYTVQLPDELSQYETQSYTWMLRPPQSREH